MTGAEIIHVFEHSRLVSDNFTNEAVTASYVAALSALREQQERENPKPLTLDEPQQSGRDRGDRRSGRCEKAGARLCAAGKGTGAERRDAEGLTMDGLTMIEIRHYILPGIGMIVIDGHAGAGEFGSDVICAAVSVLTVTLAERLRREDTKIGNGWTRITYSRRERRERESAEFAICGYRLMAEKFPLNVQYQEIRGDG